MLEIAAGTGYWTRRIVREAVSVVATDAAAAVLELARRQPVGLAAVHFARADAFHLPFRAGAFDGFLAAFWWSHVAKRSLVSFLSEVRRVLAPGAVGVFVDNRYVQGSSTPIARRDAAGDTWQERELADGTRHAVLKNFPDPAALQAALDPGWTHVDVIELEHFWIATTET